MAAKKKPALVRRKLADLLPMEGNPRRVRDAGFRALVESISTPEFGLEQGAPCSLQPVVVNRHPDFNGRIVGGQRRWEAAAEAGFKEVWTAETYLDKSQMEELNVRLNVPAGEWDWELTLELGADNLSRWGFEELDIKPAAEQTSDLVLPLPAMTDDMEIDRYVDQTAEVLEMVAEELGQEDLTAAEVQKMAMQRLYDEMGAKRREAARTKPETDTSDAEEEFPEVEDG